jgi:hypothetical protein
VCNREQSVSLKMVMLFSYRNNQGTPMKSVKRRASGRRGATGLRGMPGVTGRRGATGKQGPKGLAGRVVQVKALDRLATHFEAIYQQLTAYATRIAQLQHQLDEIRTSRQNRG